MCGIVAILNVKEQTHALRDKALKMSQKIRHPSRTRLEWNILWRKRYLGA